MKILYVEDDLAVATVAKFLFLKTDHHIVFCQTMNDAINVMSTCGQKIDLILLDLYLPDGRGVELLNYMKTAGIHVPVIVTSGFYNDHAKELRPFESSGVIYKIIHKPFLPDDLLKTLNTIEKSLVG